MGNFNQERTIQITDSVLASLNGLWTETEPPSPRSRVTRSLDGRTISLFSNFQHGSDTLTLVVEKRLREQSKQSVESDWHRYEFITDALQDVSVRILFVIKTDEREYNGRLGFLPGRFRKRY